MKVSSSIKVGILALIALTIFFMTILWVKGRSFSSAERIEIRFKDVNGMRPGSGVQMMGFRVGQVEEITPVINGSDSYVKLKFVITNPNISIPKASTISIQQSGLIGEQFLEITPPSHRTIFLPVFNKEVLPADVPVEIKLDEKYYDVGSVKKSQIITSQLVPLKFKEDIKTPYAYKIGYVVDLPGLILPEFMTGQIVTVNGKKKLRIVPRDNAPIPYPNQTSPYTIIEPMRIADFMELQYEAAEGLTETNRIINELLNDTMIANLKDSVSNFKGLTAQATSTLSKAETLMDASQKDLDILMNMMEDVSTNFNKLAVNINGIIGDENFKPALYDMTNAVTKLSNSVSPILSSVDSKAFASDLNAVMHNLNEISQSVNALTSDEQVKGKIITSIDNINLSLAKLNVALDTLNSCSADGSNQSNLQQIITDTSASVSNLRKFSEKLNKRFLLFRLMF